LPDAAQCVRNIARHYTPNAAPNAKEHNMNRFLIIAASAALTAGITANAFAQARTEKNIPLAIANEIAAAAVAECQAKGYAVTATVVDRAGQIKAVQRADNAGPHTIDASSRKAYTSASARGNTTAMMEASQKNPGAQNLGQIPGFLLLGGGMPIRAGNDVIGAVGVGGAPGGHLDDQCALAAIEKVKDRLN
jgi:uncharacterized protein GlcG (DUF336 family)